MIDSFQDEHRWLSNFWPSPIEFTIDFENETRFCKSPTVEHGFQSCKTTTVEDFELVNGQTTPGRSKRITRKLTIRPNWDEIRVPVMLDLLRCKFTQNPDLGERLILTGDQQLIEGNRWGDTFWGVCEGEGENNLGILLMQVREEIGGST